MCRSRVIYKLFLLPILSLSLIVEGCAVFGAIGDAISGGYENTVTYFNLYYNAKTAFRDAETQIAIAAKAARGKPIPAGQQQTIPADAQKNLDLVIDKCSNILAYHSSSSLVEGSLMMIGKAFFYRADYSKAERKFLELITQYPKSSWVLEAQLWYARSEKELGQYDGAKTSADALIALLEQQGENDILSQTYSLEASLNVRDNASAAAIESYQKAVKAADSDNLKGDAWAKMGQIYFNDGEYQKVVDASLKVEDLASDDYVIFQSKLLAADAYRRLQLYDKALALTGEIIDDYRFKDYLNSVLLERASILSASGRPADAFELYRKLDTTYVRTETGASAAFELAKYYESSAGDYAKAREYYLRAIVVPGLSIVADATRKIAALNSYFSYKKELATTDSIASLFSGEDSSSSIRKFPGQAVSDSVWKADSMKIAERAAKNVTMQDSLNSIQARAAAGLGELFYTDLANPDSAFYWLKFSLFKMYQAGSAPRILYILVELANTYPDKTAFSAKQYQDQLVRDFPNSYFARQIQNIAPDQQLSKEKTASSAEDAYNSAEAFIEAGKNSEALAALEGIVKNYPSSDVAAKSQYAIGWLYENRLARMDSAAKKYKLLIAQYPATSYARAVSGKVLDTASTVPARIDTVTQRSQPQIQKRDSVGVQQAVIPSGAPKPGAPLSRRARILQSMNQKKTERE